MGKCLVLHQEERNNAQAIAAIESGEACKNFTAHNTTRRLLERGATYWQWTIMRWCREGGRSWGNGQSVPHKWKTY